MDETRLQVLKEPGKSAESTSFLWAQMSGYAGASGEAEHARKAIGFIKSRYAIKTRIRNKPPNERYRERQRDALPVLAKLRQWFTKS